MYIKKLELTNFQNHAHLTLDFTNKVNVIFGKTDSGKSNIVRAIKYLFFGKPSGDVVRKEGTKKTSVKATLDNDITLERIKSASTNRYILTVRGEKKVFDAIGKEIPQAIKDVIKVRPIEVDKSSIILNVADQIALPFLLDKSGSFRMKLFNKLTGSDIIDKCLQSFNKDILRIGREERLEREHLEEGQKSLKDVEIQKIKVEEKHKKFSTLYKSLKEKYEQYKKLEESLMVLSCTEAELEIVGKKLDKIKIPKISTKDLQEKIERLENLKDYYLTIKNNKEKETTIGNDITKITIQLENCINKYKEILTKLKICPTCKQEISQDKIKEIKL